MSYKCKFCGRTTSNPDGICDYCKATLCELCGNRLARGYCAVCGRLVCDEDSVMVGFARVCKECLTRNPNLRDPHYLKQYVFSIRSPKTKQQFRQVLEVGKLDTTPRYIFIGIDDFDSPYGMCTTYAAARLLKDVLLRNSDIELMDYPLLLRYNPNVPFKTRGNAGIGLRIKVNKFSESLLAEILRYLENFPHSFFGKTKPAIAVYMNDKYAIDRELYKIYSHTVQEILPLKILKEKLMRLRVGNLRVFSLGSEARGIVGAVASIGAILDDYTYELLVYRRKENYGKERFVDQESVIKANRRYWPLTFANLDRGKVIISPAGPDPVLFGIRGDDPEVLLNMFRMIRHEDYELWCLFRTNQATNVHFKKVEKTNDAYPYDTVYLDIEVKSVRRNKDLVCLEGITRDRWKVIAKSYRLQRNIQSIITALRAGDIIRLGLAVINKSLGLIEGNVEELIPLRLQPEIVLKNPPCPICEARLKKKGKNEMYCRKCGFRIRKVFKMKILLSRKEPKVKKRYHPSPRAMRHLTMPNERIIFRARKIAKMVRPRILNEICGTIKPEKWRYGDTVKEPEVLP